jgi:hypothetical protein
MVSLKAISGAHVEHLGKTDEENCFEIYGKKFCGSSEGTAMTCETIGTIRASDDFHRACTKAAVTPL